LQRLSFPLIVVEQRMIAFDPRRSLAGSMLSGTRASAKQATSFRSSFPLLPSLCFPFEIIGRR
jgi:hypothetical protein